MAHCRNEKSDENAKRLSSQLFGESTAQTVMIRFIAFMPKSSDRRAIPIAQPDTEPGVAGFHQSVKAGRAEGEPKN